MASDADMDVSQNQQVHPEQHADQQPKTEAEAEADKNNVTTNATPDSISAQPKKSRIDWKKIFDTHMNQFESEQFVTSYFLSVPALLGFRSFVAVWTLFILIWGIVENGFVTIIPTFTYLCWIGLFIYFFYSSIHTFLYWRYKTTKYIDRLHPILKYMYWLLFMYCIAFHFIIIPVYWTFLSQDLIENGDATRWFLNVNIHILDLVLGVSEIFVSRVLFYPSQIWYFLLTPILYMFWTWVTYPTVYGGTRFVYSFLDWNKGPIVAVFYIGIFVLFVGFFYVAYGLVLLRERIAVKRGKKVKRVDGILSPDENEDDNENENGNAADVGVQRGGADEAV